MFLIFKKKTPAFLLLDVDGTLVPVGPFKSPSAKVTEAIKEAKKKIRVSIVSGRPMDWLSDIFASLELTDPCIINGGSQIVDPRTGKILWERPLEQSDVKKLQYIIGQYNISFKVNDAGIEYENPTSFEFKKPLAMQLTFFDSKDASDECLDMLQSVPNISAHKFISWDDAREYKMETYITHKEATKEHAVKELKKMLGLKKNEIIGVGDSRNDIPLLNACGLRVAMGNADNKLKIVAHYVCPPIEEDGVAHVIERFILS